jgi:hypothetical protein
MQKYNIILILQKKNVKILTPPILPRWCELAARTPIRQFHPKVIKKTFSFSGYSLSKVRSI